MCSFFTYRTIVLIAVIGFIGTSCTSQQKAANKQAIIQVVEASSATINIDSLIPGIPVYRLTNIHLREQDKAAFCLQFKEPVVVAVASQPEKWGHFQFPTIDRLPDNAIRIRWNLNDDAMEAYGNHQFGEAISKDNGVHFHLIPQQHQPLTGLLLSNGDRLTIHTPKPIPVTELQLPEAVGGSLDTYSKSTTQYYRLDDLPEKARGIYFDRLAAHGTSWKLEKATLSDPQAARYILRGNLPIIWWGDMHLAADKSVVAGVYPGFFIGTDGKAAPYDNVFFYRSADNGHHWNIQGRILYTPDSTIDTKAAKRMGFTEPGYTMMPDGTMICVMRTTDGTGNGPMYISRSTDNGMNWTKPEVLTASGVLPRLLQLQNGVLVLSSGRPGVQLRFSKDGKSWSNAFEMLSYKDYQDPVSCGYTGLLATGPDRFLIVYADFKYINATGETRKAIKVREVIVTP